MILQSISWNGWITISDFEKSNVWKYFYSNDLYKQPNNTLLFSNRSWSDVFEIKLADLSDSEYFFLQHVSDQLHMSGEDIRELMSVCEDAHTHE